MLAWFQKIFFCLYLSTKISKRMNYGTVSTRRTHCRYLSLECNWHDMAGFKFKRIPQLRCLWDRNIAVIFIYHLIWAVYNIRKNFNWTLSRNSWAEGKQLVSLLHYLAKNDWKRQKPEDTWNQLDDFFLNHLNKIGAFKQKKLSAQVNKTCSRQMGQCGPIFFLFPFM